MLHSGSRTKSASAALVGWLLLAIAACSPESAKTGTSSPAQKAVSSIPSAPEPPSKRNLHEVTPAAASAPRTIGNAKGTSTIPSPQVQDTDSWAKRDNPFPAGEVSPKPEPDFRQAAPLGRENLFAPPGEEPPSSAAPPGASDARKPPRPRAARAHVQLRGFVNVSQLRGVFSIRDNLVTLAEGEEHEDIRLVKLTPPTVVLQEGRHRWVLSLDELGSTPAEEAEADAGEQQNP